MKQLGVSRPGPARQAMRNRVMEQLDQLFEDYDRVFIQAQAGQGKTTLAAQYCSRLGVDPVWYSLSAADADPLVFIEGLYRECRRTLGSFRIPLLDEMLEKGEISPGEYLPPVERLIDELAGACTGTPLHVVLDDLHFLPGAGDTASLIAHLAATRTGQIRWMLLSRHPVAPALGDSDGSMPAGLLENADLAFTAHEIAQLYADTLSMPLGRDEVRALREITEGWVMGLLMLASRLAGDQGVKALPSTSLESLRGGSIPAFFQQQFLDRLAPRQQEQLLRLALLDTMPAELAADIAPDLDLSLLMEQNLFLKPVRGDERHAAFHHLFHDSLRALGRETLTPERRFKVLRHAADWYREKGDQETALRYLLRAGDYQAANSLSREAGLALLARNRLVTLHTLLGDVSDQALGTYPWLSYLMAVSQLNVDPPSALTHLHRARDQFEREGDGEGELLTLAQLCFFHMAVDAEYALLPELTRRAEVLFDHHAEKLSVPMRVQCAHYIGFSILQDSDRKSAHRYSSYAMRLARKHGLDNMVASLVCNQAYESAFFGDWPGFARQGDLAWELLGNPRVTSFNKFLLHLLQVNYLSVVGDMHNYRHRREVLMREVEGSILTGTLCQPFVWLWDIDTAVAEGRFDDAWHVMEQALSSESTAASDHMASQYIQYRAYIAAILGDEELAVREAERSCRLRRRAGQRFHTYVNHLMLGAVYTRLGHREKALDHLRAVIDYEQWQQDPFLPAAAWCHLAWLRLGAGDDAAARQALAEGLARMRELGYVVFFSWEPEMMKVLLELAVRTDVEADYARQLAESRFGIAILDGGERIPLLDVKTLGGLHLSLDGEGATQADLSPLQRDLLGLLFSSPQGSVSFEKILLALWPDVPPDKGRARLDTHIARLRKSLSDLLGGVDIGRYLIVENKHLCLVNARVDAWEFEQHAHKGLALARGKCWFQAANQLRIAHAAWKGGIVADDSLTADYREQLAVLYLKTVMARIDVLEVAGAMEAALRVAEKAWLLDRCNETLVKTFHDLLCRTGRQARANRLVRQYEDALRGASYEDREIIDAMDALWT